MQPEVCFTYARISPDFPVPAYKKYLSGLPQALQEKNRRFIQYRDRLLHLFGKILLRDMLKCFGFANNCLNDLTYNAYNRPYLPGNIDFNISHAGDYVICAAAPDVKLGIDIEEVTPVAFEDFNDTMTKDQWDIINNSPNSTKAFFDYWTIKESVIKADSRGLLIPLQEIGITGNTARYNGDTWFLKKLDIDTNYCTHLALSSDDFRIYSLLRTF